MEKRKEYRPPDVEDIAERIVSTKAVKEKSKLRYPDLVYNSWQLEVERQRKEKNRESLLHSDDYLELGAYDFAMKWEVIQISGDRGCGATTYIKNVVTPDDVILTPYKHQYKELLHSDLHIFDYSDLDMGKHKGLEIDTVFVDDATFFLALNKFDIYKLVRIMIRGFGTKFLLLK